MKPVFLLAALLCASSPAFATDLKCHGRAAPSDIEKDNVYANSLNYEVINNKKEGFLLKDFNDDNSTSSSSSFPKPLKEWKEGGMTVVGLPGVLQIYVHDRYHAMLAEKRGGYDNVPEYTKYVELTCE